MTCPYNSYHPNNIWLREQINRSSSLSGQSTFLGKFYTHTKHRAKLHFCISQSLFFGYHITTRNSTCSPHRCPFLTLSTKNCAKHVQDSTPPSQWPTPGLYYIVTHTIRQTETPALLEGSVTHTHTHTHTPSVRTLCIQKIASPYIFVTTWWRA